MRINRALILLLLNLFLSSGLKAVPMVQSYWLMDGSASFRDEYTMMMSQMFDYETQLNNNLNEYDVLNGVEHTGSIDAFNRLHGFVDPASSTSLPRPWAPPFGTVGPAYTLEDIQMQAADVFIVTIAGDDDQRMSVFDYENLLLPALDLLSQSAALFINIVRYPDSDPRTVDPDARYVDLVSRYGGGNFDLSQFGMGSYAYAVEQQVRSVVRVNEPMSLILLMSGLWLSLLFYRQRISLYVVE